MNKAIAVVGMCGSGKSVVTQMFEEKGFSKVYFGGVTMTELKKSGLPVSEQNERAMREGLREKYGKGAFALLLLDEITQKLAQGNVVLDGLYSWSEYKILKEKFGENLVVLAVVCNSGLRYERLATRAVRPLTASQALSRDVAEIENSEKGGPISIADAYVTNNGGVEELRRQVADFMQKYGF